MGKHTNPTTETNLYYSLYHNTFYIRVVLAVSYALVGSAVERHCFQTGIHVIV